MSERPSTIEPTNEELAPPDGEAAIEFELRRLRFRAEVDRRFKEESIGAGWKAPWDGQPALLSEQLDAERPTEPWLVDRLMGWGHNVVLAAQHGSGKTTLGQNLARSLVDGKPFLSRDIKPIDGRVGWVNGEMDQWDWMDYIRPQKVKALSRIAAMHLRDARLPLLTPQVRNAFVDWCVDNEVRVLVFDSWRRLCAWSGLDENVNADVEQMTMVIDEIKKASGVHACLILAHTGRAKAEEGEERVRGATALDDWVDARWVMIKQREQDGGARLFWAEKRGVEMPETALIHDLLTNRITLGEGNRHVAAARNKETELLFALRDEGRPASTSVLAGAIGMGKNTGPVRKMLIRMEQNGDVIRPEPQPQNGDRWALKAQ